MNVLTCAVEKCDVQFQTEVALFPNASFICKNHSENTQMKAIRFQEFAFDPTLNPGGSTKSESEEYDRDWGMSGEPITPGEKCEHGVYDPHEDQRYCTICNPAKVTAVLREIKKTKNGKIGIFKDSDEESIQRIALSLFYYTLPEVIQPKWFKDRELTFKNQARRCQNWLEKNNKSLIDQFLENK